MISQKGFVFVPAIIYAIVALIGIGTAGAIAVKNDIIPWEISIGEDIATITSSPTPTDCPSGQIYTQTGCLELQKDSDQVKEANTQATPKLTQKTVYIDPDPIINCNFSYLPSKQMKQSQCNISFECQIGSQWYIYTSRDKCTNDQNIANKQNNNYPPCIVYYPALGYSKTYNYTSPSDCSYWQQRAKTTTQPLSLPEIKAAPLPTAEPYQYSQEYLDANAKAIKNLTDPWKPTQFVAPTPKCYATWDEYFNAHPNYAPQNITGMSTTPPCD